MALEGERTANGLLRRTAEELLQRLDAAGCVISRAIGDLLVEVTQTTAGAPLEPAGHGYLLSDYPLTKEVIERCEARRVSLLEENPEPNEAELLRQLGFDSLLMLPLEALGECWGLVELYATGRAFDEDAEQRGKVLVARTGELLGQLPDYRS